MYINKSGGFLCGYKVIQYNGTQLFFKYLGKFKMRLNVISDNSQ